MSDSVFRAVRNEVEGAPLEFEEDHTLACFLHQNLVIDRYSSQQGVHELVLPPHFCLERCCPDVDCELAGCWTFRFPKGFPRH